MCKVLRTLASSRQACCQKEKDCKQTVFILAKAQLSYEDMDIQTHFFKHMQGYKGYHAITFTSYGSPQHTMSPNFPSGYAED
jgi:hypothetical protein